MLDEVTVAPRVGRLGRPVWRSMGIGLRELTLVPVIAVTILIGAFISDAFLTTGNLLNILQQSSELSVIAETMIDAVDLISLSLLLVLPQWSEGGLVTSGRRRFRIGVNPYVAISSFS
jgi:hypothetical protein